jgi:cytochrome b561
MTLPDAHMTLHEITIPLRRETPSKPRRFDSVTIALHWMTVVLILGMFSSAWMRGLVHGPGQAGLVLTIHRSLGVSVWAMAVCRLGWRLGFAFLPPFPRNMSKRQQTLAKISEYGLYTLLLVQPLTGLAQSLTSGRPFVLFGMNAPTIMVPDRELTHLFHAVHEVSAWSLLSLISLHVLAALFHRFVMRDDVLQSMLPWKPSIRPVAPLKARSRIAAGPRPGHQRSSAGVPR